MDTKNYKMLHTVRGSRDGLTIETFNKGETYSLSPELAEQFYHQGAVEEVGGLQARKLADGEMLEEGELPAGSKVKKGAAVNPADLRETKVTGPTETKEGEAGVPTGTQHVEELVTLARDTYGLEADSTMSEEDLREMIEAAQVDSAEEYDAEGDTDSAKKKSKKAKK